MNRERGRLWCPPMSLCAHCGQTVLGGSGVCAFHLTGQGDDWAAGNRIMCDFFHRGIVLPRPPEPASHSSDSLFHELQAAEMTMESS